MASKNKTRARTARGSCSPYLGFFGEDPDEMAHASRTVHDAVFETAAFVPATVSAERIAAAARWERRAAGPNQPAFSVAGFANCNAPIDD